jgi:hypothetical protein
MTAEDVIKFIARKLRVDLDRAADLIPDAQMIDNAVFIRFATENTIIAKRDRAIVAIKYINPTRREVASIYFKAGMPVAFIQKAFNDSRRLAKLVEANRKRKITLSENKNKRLAEHAA